MNKIKISEKFDLDTDFVLFPDDVNKLLPIIPDNFVSLIVTSPPYNIGKSYEYKKSIKEYISGQEKIIHECVRILKPNGSICWQVGNYVDNSSIIPIDILLYPVFEKYHLKLRNRIIWRFGHGLHAKKRFSGRYEVILWFTKTDDYYFNIDPIRVPQKYPNKKYFKGPKKGQLSGNPLGKNPSDIWDIPNVKSNHIEKTNHPCQFPIELIERLVLSMTQKNDWVLDPFMGVGSTAIAALMHDRKAIGAEIQEEYIKTTKERIKLAEEGKLKIRPMGRKVYDPENKDEYIPPMKVEIGKAKQPAIFEKQKKYLEDEKIEKNI
jgi:adenine-specific DNA-methyltransferase